MLTQGQEFHSEIKEARIKHGLTIRQVEHLTGVPYRSLQNWEAGVRKCPDYVTKMIVNMINRFDHQMFLELLHEILKADAENIQNEEVKKYIQNLIPTIAKQIRKDNDNEI